jgi:hypothetical protein
MAGACIRGSLERRQRTALDSNCGELSGNLGLEKISVALRVGA